MDQIFAVLVTAYPYHERIVPVPVTKVTEKMIYIKPESGSGVYGRQVNKDDIGIPNHGVHYELERMVYCLTHEDAVAKGSAMRKDLIAHAEKQIARYESIKQQVQTREE